MSDFITVKPGISSSVKHEIDDTPSLDHYLSAQIKRLGRENKDLMEELCAYALAVVDVLKPGDPQWEQKISAHVVAAGVLTYRMLESQHEANNLDELLGE